MAEGSKQKQEVVERSEVAPAAGGADTTSLVPLTFFDIHWAGPSRVKRIYLYYYPHSISHFMETTLPSLKHSLSLALQLFFPLAGNLYCPPPPNKPFIHYTPNVDSVPLTIIHHSPSIHFKHLIANHPRDLEELDHLVAELALLPKPCHDNEDILMFPILSLKITLFPGEGLCIGATYRHVFDGRSFNHFITSWTSLCLNNGALASLPFLNREVVGDPKGLEAVLLEQYFNKLSIFKHILKGPPLSRNINTVGGDEHIVRLTLALDAVDLERLKKWVSLRCKPPPINLPRMMVTCALLWVSLVRSTRGSLEDDEEQEELLVFQADCRNRLPDIPSTYFGTCLVPVNAELKRKDFVGEESVVAAVKVIDAAMSRMKSDPLEDAQKAMTRVFELAMSRRAFTTVAGSPNFGSYELDFGFGRPTKVEIVNGLDNFAFAESRKEGGGFEVGLSLKRDQVDPFLAVFQQGLQTLSQSCIARCLNCCSLRSSSTDCPRENSKMDNDDMDKGQNLK